MNVAFVFLSILSTANAVTPVYKAQITALSSSGVYGIAVVYSNDSTVGYAGFANGVAADQGAADCTAKNGCGAHIHSGMSCADTSSQGGHYFVDPVAVDPWIDERYVSDSQGAGAFSGVIDIGTNDLNGRAFLIHDASGARVGCGLLEQIEESELLVGMANDIKGLAPISGSGVSGSVTVYEPDSQHVCYFGRSVGLSAGVSSFLEGGVECTSTNGCGAHIHSGTSCADPSSQGGHYFSTSEDPWKNEGYKSTSSDGAAFYVGCVETGETSFTKKPFIVHEEDGSRVACGLLETCETFRECKTFLGGSGLWMTRGTTEVPLVGWNYCKSHCIPPLFQGLVSILGYDCGRCKGA